MILYSFKDFSHISIPRFICIQTFPKIHILYNAVL